VRDVIDVGPPVCIYLATAPLAAVSTSAVAWMRANMLLAQTRRELFASFRGDDHRKPSGMTAVLSSVPSFDGDAPR